MDIKPMDLSMSRRFEYSVAIVAARETPFELKGTLDAAIAAIPGATIIDILINGNRQLAAAFSELLNTRKAAPHDLEIRVWYLPLGGKAHAWNEYIHRIWPASKVSFFIDGYVAPLPNAFQLLADGLARSSKTIAATGCPSIGRSAQLLREQTLREGGLYGGFFALKGDLIEELRARGIRLPLGLYGFDTLLGGMLGYGLDSLQNEWNPKERIYVDPEATWTNDERKWWRYSDAKTQVKRILNNALRVLVCEATKHFLEKEKRSLELMPPTVEQFVLGWMAECPESAQQTLRRSPLCHLALKKLKKPHDWSLAESPPQQMF